jgi:Tfp pilus assembly protein PilF
MCGSRVFLLMAFLLACDGTGAEDFVDCGTLTNAYGPFDYRDAQNRAEKIPIVERHHFNSDVESLRRGQTGHIMGDLDYTLRAVPNHPRALASVARYQLGGGAHEGYRTADCYFDRALRFTPDDGTVRLMFGTYLHRKKDYEGAQQQYQAALGLMPDSPEVHYNFALLWLDLDQIDKARTEAIQAYRLGHPLPGLKNKLKRRGVWGEQEEQAIAARATR